MFLNYRKFIIIYLFISFCIISKVIIAVEPKEKGYLNIGDAKLYYQTFGNGEPIIILHGGPGLGFGYLLPQMLQLSSTHELIFYDQRGSGKSLHTSINEQTINMKRFIADLDALRKDLGYKKITLLGHSWGGLLAMNYAIAYPQNVRAMILANSAPASRAEFIKFITEYDKRTKPISDELHKMHDSPQFMSGDPETIKKYYSLIFSTYFADPDDVEELSLQQTPLAALNGFKVASIMQKTYLSNQFNLLPALAKLKVPTLIIHGAEDLVPLSSDEQINNAIINSQLLLIEDCGHFPYIEQPTVFFTVIENFLKENDA